MYYKSSIYKCMRKPKRLINKIYVVLSLFKKKKGIMAKDGRWSANLSDLPKIHRYGVVFFTISLYLAKYKNNSKFFLKISHFLFFHRRKIYQGEVIYKIYEKRYFFLKRRLLWKRLFLINRCAIIMYVR